MICHGILSKFWEKFGLTKFLSQLLIYDRDWKILIHQGEERTAVSTEHVSLIFLSLTHTKRTQRYHDKGSPVI